MTEIVFTCESTLANFMRQFCQSSQEILEVFLQKHLLIGLIGIDLW